MSLYVSLVIVETTNEELEESPNTTKTRSVEIADIGPDQEASRALREPLAKSAQLYRIANLML